MFGYCSASQGNDSWYSKTNIWKISIRSNYASKCIISIYHEVTTQEGLEEATLATANVSKDITAEDAALGLLLLQVNLLSSGHCRGENHTRASEDQLSLLLYTTHGLQSVSYTDWTVASSLLWQRWFTAVIINGMTVSFRY